MHNNNTDSVSNDNEQFLLPSDVTEEDLIRTQEEIASLKSYREQLQPQTDLFSSQFNVSGDGGTTKGNTLVKTDHSGINYIDPNNPMHPSGFANRLIIALLAGFGLGVITTAIYIFVGLGHVNVSL